MKQFKVNKITDAIDDLSVETQRNAQMANEQMVEATAENTMDLFNSGCDLVLSHIEGYIVKLEDAGGTPEEKYTLLLKTIAGMRAVVEKRRAPKAEEPAIIVPESQIIIAS
jgi:hypothetical protein